MVQIYKRQAGLFKRPTHARFFEHQARVATMTLAFSDDHLFSIETAEYFRGSDNDGRVGVDVWLAHGGFDQIRFQDNSLATHLLAGDTDFVEAIFDQCG